MGNDYQYNKTSLRYRKSGGRGEGAIAADKVADSWEDCDIHPAASYDKGWWAETKRMVDEGYAKLQAKGFFDDTSDYWAKRRKTDPRCN
jgi:hypothetical protein